MADTVCVGWTNGGTDGADIGISGLPAVPPAKSCWLNGWYRMDSEINLLFISLVGIMKTEGFTS